MRTMRKLKKTDKEDKEDNGDNEDIEASESTGRPSRERPNTGIRALGGGRAPRQHPPTATDTHRHPPKPTDTHQHAARVSTTTTAGHECESADSRFGQATPSRLLPSDRELRRVAPIEKQPPAQS